MGLISDVGSAVYTRLATTAGTAHYGTRIYDSLAPVNIASPYVIFQHIEGADLNISPSRIIDVEFRVECVALSANDARIGADHIESALRETTVSMSGWSQIAVTLVDLFSEVEQTEGKQFWRRGGFYRLRYSQ
jgi:hypothetical protein